MTDFVNPSDGAELRSYTMTTATELAGGHSGYIIPNSDSPTSAAQELPVNDANLNQFDETSSSTSLDVTIDPGEAAVGGAYLVRDTETTVTLDASTTGQIVYLGWSATERNTVIIGLDSAFSSNDKRIELYSYDTDADGVTN